MATHSGINSSRGRRRGSPPSTLRIAGDPAAATAPSRPSPPPAAPAVQPEPLAAPVAVAAAPAGPDVVALAQATVGGREQQRRERIERAAYFRAERRGFAPGHEVEDWLAAEVEVAAAQADGTLSAD
jgi:hypothetical protein